MQGSRDRDRAGSKRGAALVLASLAVLVICAGGVGALASGSPWRSTLSPSPAPLAHARRLLDEGKIADAREIFECELKRDAKNKDVIRGLALCARDEGDDESALQYFQKLTALAPKDLAGWRQQALAAARLGRDMEALAAAQTALSLAPKGDRSMSDLMTRLLTSDPDSLASPLNRLPGGTRGLDPMYRGSKGSGFDPLGDVPNPETPDPTRGLPRPGRGN